MTSEQILKVLEREAFAEWYRTIFDDYIQGAYGDKDKEKILKDIEHLFNECISKTSVR